MSSVNVISIVKSKHVDISSEDINLLLNYIYSNPSFKIYENWSPICLPGKSNPII